MIKIQKRNFNTEKEIHKIISQYKNIGGVSTFIGYVRNTNNNQKVYSINLEVYKDMALKYLFKLENKAKKKWDLIDVLIIHRFGELKVNEKIVLVATFSKHRKQSYLSCNYIMNYLKKDAPFWKKEIYKKNYKWLRNIK